MNPLAGLAIVLDATEQQVQFALMAGRFEDYTPVLRSSVVAILREMEALHFDTEGDISGNKWPELAPETIRDRVRRGYGAGPMMVRTMKLRQSLARPTKTPDSIVKISKFGIVFGTSVEYADYHQQTQGAGHVLPQRQVIPDPLPDFALEELQIAVRDYLIEGRIRRS